MELREALLTYCGVSWAELLDRWRYPTFVVITMRNFTTRFAAAVARYVQLGKPCFASWHEMKLHRWS